MQKFTISLHGRGSEIYAHDITEEQREKLEHLNLDECIVDDVANILDFDSPHKIFESKEVYVGVYQENSQITVMDELEEEIFSELCEKVIMSESISDDTEETVIYDKLKLYVNDNIKGNIFLLEIEDETFDLKKLKFHYTKLGKLNLITGITYNSKKNDFDFYWSKGVNYFLSYD
jgi:hypothetical protein